MKVTDRDRGMLQGSDFHRIQVVRKGHVANLVYHNQHSYLEGIFTSP